MGTKSTVAERIRELREMKVPELVAQYTRAYGEKPRSQNRDHLWRKIAWKEQADAEGGGLSEGAKARLAEIAADVDAAMEKRGAKVPMARAQGASTTGNRSEIVPFPRVRREGLPLPGTVLTREYHGTTLRATVLEEGVEHEGVTFRSLSALACAITGSHVSGHAFFRLKPRKADSTRRKK